MPTPAWLRDVLVVVGTTGVKALRAGAEEGVGRAVDSVLEDVEVFTNEVARRVRGARKKRKTKTPDAPVVIDAEIEEE